MVRVVLELGVPAALYLRDVEFHRLGGTVPLDRRLLVLANSRFTAGRARQDLGVEAQVLPPLVRPDAYRVRAPGDRVLFVNPHPDKGVEIAFALAERRPDVPFLFVESWPLPDDVRQAHLRRAACLPNVEWSERVGDMRSVYARARIVLAPSLWEEAWGRIATEAQVSGIPVLASTRGGLPESVGPGGLLVDPDAPLEEWARALSRLWDDRATYARLSTAALEHARRPEIQPTAVVMPFRQLLARHAAAT
jgi:glycosyltransferase involved in cell wall biosynthesis